MEIADLPDLALLEVFSFFSNEEKIKCLSLVCKRWYLFLQNDIQQLAICDFRSPFRLFWNVFSRHEIDERFIVRTKVSWKETTFKFGNLKNLKRLFLFKTEHLHRLFNSLNEGFFDQLVELKIVPPRSREGWCYDCCVFFFKSEPKQKISLPNLRKLYYDGNFYSEKLRVLDVPNLESVVCPIHDFPDFVPNLRFPERIKFILCGKFRMKQSFDNLEHLICRRTDSFFKLEKLPRLKRVELFPKKKIDFEIIEDLKMQKKRLNRQDLDIWVAGFKENFTPELVDCFTNWCGIIPNRKKPFSLDPFDHLDYNEPLSVYPWQVCFTSEHLFRKFPNLEGIPPNFFRVFIKIYQLDIDNKVDGENLIRFLKNIKTLESFKIWENYCEPSIIRGLSQIQSLRYLKLSGIFPRRAHYDISCIFNLKNLELLEIFADAYLKISTNSFVEFLKNSGHKLRLLKVGDCRQFISVYRGGLLDENIYAFSYEEENGRPIFVNGYQAKWRSDWDMFGFESLDDLIAIVQKVAEEENSIFSRPEVAMINSDS